ncbi:MAG TPA: PEP/pyruvate-binding domain-containing protein [Allocoleopsis sp.]
MNTPIHSPIHLIDAFDEASCGGKAIQLGAAIRAGLPVPPGFVLTAPLVDAIAAQDPGAINLAVQAFTQLESAVAVRSSAVGEDSSQASFAGQHLTCLNICSSTSLIEAVQQVWQSGRSVSAQTYRQRLGITQIPEVAVVVQQFIPATQAGVMFTRNPINGEDERLIEASWGLGEAIVSGMVTPDHYRLTRQGQVLERHPGMKDIAVYPIAEGQTQQVEVEPHRIHLLCLEDWQLEQLNHLATQCEQYFQQPLDMEWCFEGDRLYLLQCRAITRISTSLV